MNITLLTGVLKDSYYWSRGFLWNIVIVDAAAPNHSSGAQIHWPSSTEHATDTQSALEFRPLVLACLRYHCKKKGYINVKLQMNIYQNKHSINYFYQQIKIKRIDNDKIKNYGNYLLSIHLLRVCNQIV